MIVKNLIERIKKKAVFITIILENIIRTLIVLLVLNTFSNSELANLGILQATIGIFTIILPMGFGVSSQRFSIDTSSKEFSSANTLYYIICFFQVIVIYFIWDYIIYKIEGLNFLEPFYKFIFLVICFLKVELAKIKAILRILGKNKLFILLSLLPILLESLLVYIYLDFSSTAFDLFTIRIISMLPVLFFTIYLLRYLTLYCYDKKVINYSLITIPNKFVTASLGYFMNLFAFNLGTEYMAKFYSSLKVTNLLNTVLNAYYQYVEPSFYKNKGIIKKINKTLVRNTLILSLLFISVVFLIKLFFNSFKITENLSFKIIALVACVYILTMIFRFISFKLFFNLRNDLIFYANLITIMLFTSVSYLLPTLFLEALIFSLFIKLLLTNYINKKYFKANE